MGYLSLTVLWFPLTYWIQCLKPCCFIYTIQRIGAWGLGHQTQSWGKGFTICMCLGVCVCAHMSTWHQREKASLVYSLYNTSPTIFLPSPSATIYARDEEGFLWYTVMSQPTDLFSRQSKTEHKKKNIYFQVSKQVKQLTKWSSDELYNM